ncbi:hypothetical protein OROHE_008484 [Orobanche hederae]
MSDSIPNVSINVASSNPKDFSKKKRANRSAKLKQCKLDVRREQWLSQVKTKGGCKEEVNSGGSASKAPPLHSVNGRGKPVEKLEVKTRSEDEIYGDGSMHRYSDSESIPSNSPTSHTSSMLCSSVNFTASSRSSSSSGRSSSSNSNGFCSGHMSDEDGGGDAIDDDDDGDDWEAVADALEAKDKNQQDCSPKTACGGSPTPKTKHENAAEVDKFSTEKLESGGKEVPIINCCAWSPDDAYRPQNLPNLTKQYSFPLNSERHVGRGSVWGCQNISPIPTSCPICFEDFDCTDSSFLPCSCGFRLCLFCHKRILEEDGRCPGCRKKYEGEPIIEGEATLDGGSLTFRLARSCSMITRS